MDTPGGFPRSPDRGLIEAAQAAVHARSGSDFRDHLIAALLKRVHVPHELSAGGDFRDDLIAALLKLVAIEHAVEHVHISAIT